MVDPYCAPVRAAAASVVACAARTGVARGPVDDAGPQRTGTVRSGPIRFITIVEVSRLAPGRWLSARS